MCNSLCSSIVSGTTKLVKNTAFPALFVTIGQLPKFQKYLPSISLTEIANTSFKPADISSYVGSKLNSTWVSISSTDINGLRSSLLESTKSLDIKGFGSSLLENARDSFENLPSTFENHKVAIGFAAGIGASATMIDFVLKRIPVTRNTNPFLRLTVSLALGTAATFYAANEVFQGHTIDPQTIMDIAIKVGVVGGMMKLVTTSSRLGLKAIRGSSDWLSWTVSGVCTGFIGITNALDWGSLPTTLEGDRKKTKQPDAKPKTNGSSPREGADLQGSTADLEDTDNKKVLSSPKKRSGDQKAETPQKERKKLDASTSKTAQTPKKENKETADLEKTTRSSADLEDEGNS